MNMEKKETICCSAVYYDDGIPRVHMPRNIHTGIVVCGLRHNNCYTVMAELFPNREYLTNRTENQQGFLTSFNRFVSRGEAATIAFNAGQLENDYSARGIASEDLW